MGPPCAKDAGEPLLLRTGVPVAERPVVRDLRKPCPDACSVSAGGAEGSQA
jgi:hypothetical protein